MSYIRKKDGVKLHRVTIDTTPEEYEILYQKAKEDHRTVASYIKSKVFQ